MLQIGIWNNLNVFNIQKQDFTAIMPSFYKSNIHSASGTKIFDILFQTPRLDVRSLKYLFCLSSNNARLKNPQI